MDCSLVGLRSAENLQNHVPLYVGGGGREGGWTPREHVIDRCNPEV